MYYFVCFKNHGSPRWWNYFLHPQALHVFALKWTGVYWVMVHPRIAYLEVQVLYEYELEEDIVRIVENMEIVGLCKVNFDHLDTDRIRLPWVFGPWTCVEQIKALVGIRAPWVLTPRQLWKYLRGLNYG